MSSLANQLGSIKLSQTALKVGPHQQQPTILFDKQTARNTSIDTIYSMSILAYDKLQTHLSNSLEEVQNREELLSQTMKEINRNTLTKDENNKLSRKLEKFIIELAPYLLNSECQQILEYLLRNFKVNVFETETLVLAFLQYWNYEIFQKLIANINKRQMTGKLTFLNQMVSTEQINFAFIVKTLIFSHAVFDKLISIVLEGSLLEVKTAKDVVVKMQSDEKIDEHFLKHALKNFLLKIFLALIKDKKTNHYKYIIDFCSSCLRIRYPSSGTDEKFELMASVLILLSNLVIENGISDEYLSRTVQKLVKKFVVNHQTAGLSERSLKLVFDFVFIVWQRKSHLIDRATVETLSFNASFLKYFKQSTASKYMIFHHLWNAICFEGVKCEALLETIGVSIKTEQFYRLHETSFLGLIFQVLEQTFTETRVEQKQLKWLENFVKNSFKLELGLWVNESRKSGKVISEELVNAIFISSEINAQTSEILVQKIQKVLPQRKQVQSKVSLGIERMRMQQEQQESEHQDQEVKQTRKGKKLVEYLRSKGVEVDSEIDFSDQNTKKTLLQLFSTSYDKTQQDKISFHQRSLIVEKYGRDITYTASMLQSDLQREQYSIAIKWFSSQQESQICQTSQGITLQFSFLEEIFSFILGRKQQLQNILFKELMRLSINRLLEVAKMKYKQVVLFLHKYYKKLTLGCKSLSDYVQVNGLMLRVSERLFSTVGSNKGKYQNLIHSHCKLLAILINNIDAHEFNQDKSSPLISHSLLQHTYHTIIKIFGAKELYLINTGTIELITRKELNYQKLKYFIDEIMAKQLNYQIDTRKQSQLGVNYYEHALSIGRSLIFGSYMLGSGQAEWINSISPMLTSGIAKNQVAIFYGLVKDKLKRNIVRKLFLFFKLTYDSKHFVQGFKNYLSSIDDTDMTKLLHIYSQIYYILLSIDIKDDPKIQSVIETLLDKITNLFSLDLRFTLFKPLLPNTKLYSYLNAQLEQHKEADFKELAELINIVPNEPSLEWVGFVKECLKRHHIMSSQCAQEIFTNAHFLNNEANFESFCELTCYLSEHSKDTLIPYINQCMNIVLAVCQTDTNQDYCLSLLYRIIINMKELVDPFVHDVYRYALECDSEFVQKFISETVEGLTVPTLIESVKNLSKTSKHLYNFGVFFKYVCKHGVGHLLAKTLQYFASKIIHSAVKDQVDLSSLYDLTSDIFLEMTLKFNQNELRKVLIDFVRWSQIKQNQEIGISFNMRKIIISSIFCKLSANLGNLFTPFYGYVFDSYLKDLDLIVSDKTEKSKDGKRQRTESNFADLATLTYGTKVLESLSLLFVNDVEKEFLDATKFDLLSERLSNLFTIERLQYSEYMQLTKVLSSCLMKLCKYLTDDYQLKSLNLKILLLLRLKVPRLQEAIFTFMDKLIDEIQDRYLLFINDLVPFLIDNIHNRNEKVKVPIKSIINKFEEMSGSKIENYMR